MADVTVIRGAEGLPKLEKDFDGEHYAQVAAVILLSSDASELSTTSRPVLVDALEIRHLLTNIEDQLVIMNMHLAKITEEKFAANDWEGR
jgi:hypothetical protein